MKLLEYPYDFMHIWKLCRVQDIPHYLVSWYTVYYLYIAWENKQNNTDMKKPSFQNHKQQ